MNRVVGFAKCFLRSPLHWCTRRICYAVFCLDAKGKLGDCTQACTHPVPAGDLDAVLVHDADDAGRVEPGLAVGLHGHALVAEDADDDGAALRDPVPLQVHDARRAHVDRR